MTISVSINVTENDIIWFFFMAKTPLHKLCHIFFYPFIHLDVLYLVYLHFTSLNIREFLILLFSLYKFFIPMNNNKLSDLKQYKFIVL